MQYFNIGDVIFIWEDGGFALSYDSFVERFRISKSDIPVEADCVRYCSEYYPLEQLRKYRCLKRNGLYELFETEKGKMLIYHWATCRFAYGYLTKQLGEENTVICYFNPKMREEIPITAARFFSTAGMHTKLLQRSAVILHASYIDWDGSAILFAAPSGTGKSTQAELWEQYAGAEIINGDRALLRRRGSVWHAFGYPCCGSSMICQNRTLPLKAIVILEQAKENRVESLSASQKIRALVSGTEIYLWDTDEINQAFHLAEQISKEVPVIKLACRPDKNAVTVLKEYLEVI